MVIGGHVRPWPHNEEVDLQLSLSVKNACDMATNFIEQGFDVFIDGVVGRKLLEQYSNFFKDKNFQAFLLMPSLDSLLNRYNSGNKISIENTVSSNDTFTKYSCTYFASCYLSLSPSTSINTDLNGTFLRNKNEPIFYSNEIGLEQAKKLMGIEGNPVWIDTTYTPVKSYAEVASLIKNKTNIDKEELPNFIHTNQAPPNNKGSKLYLHAQISKWSSEKIDISYSAPFSSYIFLPINFDKNWKATIGDQSLNIYAANLGGLAISAPASSGKNIVLKRNDPEVNFLWASRIALILLSGCFLIFLIRMTLKEANR